ncbi:MAG: metabolite traffic protein EboE [Phycisphaerae bacterium]|nr:metabolite traffic protein EboE [Phycisphaerae bacterium]
MKDTPRPGAISGYCSNVHAGSNLDETIANLAEHTLNVKQIVSPDEPMGVGLWLSAKSAHAISSEKRLTEFKNFLDENDLIPFTFNGFPYGDFHAPVVKHKVYRPDWTTAERFDYTIELAIILSQLIDEGGHASISTLPLGWPGESRSDWPYEQAAGQLLNLTQSLRILEEATGRYISVSLEPEPGCLLDTADDVISFFNDHLLGKGRDDTVLRYLGVCHDICHSAVMFEPQLETIKAYAGAGIEIFKVHVSSAVEADFTEMSDADKIEALKQLRNFHEPRYLHQTSIHKGDYTLFYEDLINAIDAQQPSHIWRSHFHVPIYLETLDLLRPTQNDIIEGMQAIKEYSDCSTFEIETYAWGVLPKQLQVPILAEGIAAELQWFKETFSGSV